MIAPPRDRRWLARPVARAATRGALGPRQVRAAVERSPRWGAGRGAEPSKRVGHALRKAWSVSARQQRRGRRAVGAEAGACGVAGPSRHAAWDVAWDDPQAPPHVLPMLLAPLRAVAHGLETPPAPAATASQVAATMTGAPPGQAHDSVTTPEGTPPLRHGVAAARRRSVEDAERRHGRQRRRRRVEGDKRQGRRALDARRLGAVGLTLAPAPEASVPAARAMDWAAPQCTRRAWPRARASLATPWVHQRPETWALVGQAWPVRPGPYVPTSACQLEGERDALRCPGGATRPCAPGGVVTCPAATGGHGGLRERCPASASGRRVRRPPAAALVQAWRERQQTGQGRAPWRERVAVEQALAQVGRWQGRRARSRGVRKHVLALRRCAVVHHVHVFMHRPQRGQAA